MDNTLIPGWYGKMPAMGDFSCRRLPTEFVQYWDTWLQQSIITSRAQLGESWLNVYLNCPIWRFILMPKLFDQNIWTGILMPSVDKVGRYFPLTIAMPLEVSPGTLSTIINAQAWFTEIEQSALKSLNAYFTQEDLDQRLIENPFPANRFSPSKPAIQEFIQWWNTDSNKIEQLCVEEMPLFFSSLMEYQFTQSETHKTLWWNKLIDTKVMQLKCFTGLPETEQFITLLKGSGNTLTCPDILN